MNIKKYFLVIMLLFLFCKNGAAQKYHPFDTNMVWKVLQTGRATSGTCYRNDAYNYFVKGYIVNNGRYWHKLYANVFEGAYHDYNTNAVCTTTIVQSNSTQFMGLFSNDTLNKKVFFVPSQTLAPNYVPTDANLIFSSNKIIGDTMDVFSGANPSMRILRYKINAIDSVLLGTQYHKRFTGTTTFTANYSPTTGYFIEGVGSCHGVFNSYFYIFNTQSSKLLCFSDTNYTKYYTYPGQTMSNMAPPAFPNALRDTSACFSDINVGLRTNLLNSNLVSVYPNPASGILNIDAGENEFTQLEVLNSIGHIVKNKTTIKIKNFQINVLDLPNGIYILNLKSDNLGTVTKKFVVDR